MHKQVIYINGVQTKPSQTNIQNIRTILKRERRMCWLPQMSTHTSYNTSDNRTVLIYTQDTRKMGGNNNE